MGEIKASAWKEDYRYSDSYRYRLQIDNIPGKRNFRRLLKEIEKEWRVYGDGFNQKAERFTILATKDFNSLEEWLEWARNFSYNLVEYNRNDEPKSIRLGSNYRKRLISE
jgi:hypothetical protein